MATKEQIEDVIFNGGLPSDAEMSEDDNSSDDFNGFDEDADSEENDEESMQEDDDSEDSEPAPRKNKKESVAELLRQQVAQNNLLMQRLAGNAPQPAYSEEDRKALEEGRALLNMQRNNPALYNKLGAFELL